MEICRRRFGVTECLMISNQTKKSKRGLYFEQ